VSLVVFNIDLEMGKKNGVRQGT